MAHVVAFKKCLLRLANTLKTIYRDPTFPPIGVIQVVTEISTNLVRN